MKASIKGFAIAALGLGLVLSAREGWAGSKIFDPFGFPATRFSGTIEGNAAQNRDPFVVQIFSAGNECLRIAGVSQGADLEATLVGVDGRVWQDDDGGPGILPLINAVTNIRGWYILVIHHFAGSFFSTLDFTVDVTRLSSASCVPLTPPRITAPTSKSAGSLGPVTPGGTN